MDTNTEPLVLAAAVLIGGDSRRFGGFPKGLLRLPGGMTLLEHLIGQLEAAQLADVFIVGTDRGASAGCHCPLVPDLRPGLGPLAGIESALAYCEDRAQAVLILPCDLPGFGVAEIAALREAYVSQGDKPRVLFAEKPGFFSQPLCAIVPVGVRSVVQAALDRGVRRVREVWQELGARAVALGNSRAFFNVNTPADLARWQNGEVST